MAGAHGAFAKRHAELLKELEANEAWQKISGTQRITIMSEEGISSVPDLEVGSDEQLLSALQQTPVSRLERQDGGVDGAIPKRGAQSGEAARTQNAVCDAQERHAADGGDVKAWLGAQETTLVAKLKEGPVVIG